MIRELIRHSAIYQQWIVPLRSLNDWRKRSYSENSPQFIKQAILIKYGLPEALWVETGTYLGTTADFLAQRFPKVISIEPEPDLFCRARDKFTGRNIEVLNGVSEDIFPTLLPTIQGEVNFWLDGHYSAGITFKGEKDCPIEDELSYIAQNLSNFTKVTILIDDVRCFLPQNEGKYSGYPTVDYLIDWTKRHRFAWRIEHDIFVMTSH